MNFADFLGWYVSFPVFYSCILSVHKNVSVKEKEQEEDLLVKRNGQWSCRESLWTCRVKRLKKSSKWS